MALNLEKLERQLDDALEKETPESLKMWLHEKRKGEKEHVAPKKEKVTKSVRITKAVSERIQYIADMEGRSWNNSLQRLLDKATEQYKLS